MRKNSMKKFMRKITGKANEITLRARLAVTNNRGEGYVDTGIKLLIAVVLGALLLGGLYTLFGDTILPTITQKIQDLFNYAG